MKQLYPLKDADIDLVLLREEPKGIVTPHCKIHRAMNKLTSNGIWRCVSTYKWDFSNPSNIRFIENNCKAGCEYR